MCGIVGFADFRSQPRLEPELLDRMRDRLAHRGPDDRGSLLHQNVGLGSRRLSIIDIADGRMPMSNEDGSVWIVFNGEIYNFGELRKHLELRGHVFRTRSDTEVIIHAYEQYGLDCVEHLSGMFAFAIHDRARGRLFLARDRLGEKPLHYHWDGSLFVFASEIKALLEHPDVPRTLDPLSLSKYLTYEFVPAPHSLFKGIRKLKPGHSMVLDAGARALETERYWDIPLTDDPINYRHIEGHAEELLYRLDESVKGRLVSDVPVGLFLSGGIDSSTVAALAARHHAGPIRAFTISFDDRSFDESAHARQVARHLGVDHEVEPCRIDDIVAEIPAIIDRLDEPLGDASFVPTFLLSRFAARHVKVVLGGDGGDELLAGYPTFQALKFVRYYNILPAEVRAAINWIAGMLPVSLANISFDFKVKQLLRGAGVSEEVMFFLWMGSFTEAEKARLLSPALRVEILKENAFEDLFDYIKESNLKNEMERALYLSAKLYLQDDILVKVDRASMANSLEVRAPFLDHTLVEFISRLPTFFKLHRLTTKYVLKKAVAGLVPPRIIHRSKKGFGMPVGRWINGAMSGLFDDALSEESIRRDGIFDPRYVRGLLDEHRAGRKDNRKLLWTLFVFQLWKQNWLKG